MISVLPQNVSYHVEIKLEKLYKTGQSNIPVTVPQDPTPLITNSAIVHDAERVPMTSVTP
jgi:hypothetical protein